RLVQRKVFAVEPVRTPPPPTAFLPAGQSCCWVFGLLLFDRPLPEISCRPTAPAGPGGPAGPRGIWPGAKSTARSEAFLTFAELTALFFSWAGPTLLRGSAVETAKAAPLNETARARQATTIAGEGGRRRMDGRDCRRAPGRQASKFRGPGPAFPSARGTTRSRPPP